MNLAVIPARGGSKRIPRKNIKEFCGKPSIVYSIEAALRSSLFDEILVSTDCVEIAEMAKRHGASVPYLRPSTLSDDYTPTIPVIRHAIVQAVASGRSFDRVCCIYATAPFITVSSIRESYDLLVSDSEADFAMPITTYPYPVQRSLTLDMSGCLAMPWDHYAGARSQDLVEHFHDAGQFYWGTTKAWKQCENILMARTRGLLLPRHLVQDLDTDEDWERAELMYKALHEPQGR